VEHGHALRWSLALFDSSSGTGGEDRRRYVALAILSPAAHGATQSGPFPAAEFFSGPTRNLLKTQFAWKGPLATLSYASRKKPPMIAIMWVSRRGGRVVDCGGLENR
jgi:hypothetical protein